MNTAHALQELVDAIDANVERRVLLDLKPGERRTDFVLLMHTITPELTSARRAIEQRERSIAGNHRPLRQNPSSGDLGRTDLRGER